MINFLIISNIYTIFHFTHLKKENKIKKKRYIIYIIYIGGGKIFICHAWILKKSIIFASEDLMKHIKNITSPTLPSAVSNKLLRSGLPLLAGFIYL